MRDVIGESDAHFEGFQDLMCQAGIEVRFRDDWGRRLKVLCFWRMRSVFILTRKLCSRLIFVFDDGISFAFL